VCRQAGFVVVSHDSAENVAMSPEHSIRLAVLSRSDFFRPFHVIIHMIDSLVTCHLTNVWPSRTLFRVMNLVVLRKFDMKHYQGFGCAPTHIPTGHVYDRRSLSYRSLSFPFRTLSVLLCFSVVISRTKTAIEYPSINLVLYSYTPNEELDSWQIVLAHLTSFLEP
jgi:hypothetical protein